MKENRLYKRAELSIRIRVRETDTDIEGSFNLKDLSEGGLFITSPLLWDPGQLFDLSFSLPGSQHIIHAVGEVARAEDKYSLTEAEQGSPVPGMGVRFIEISEENVNRIRTFITAG